jgi:hypothetical protein
MSFPDATVLLEYSTNEDGNEWSHEPIATFHKEGMRVLSLDTLMSMDVAKVVLLDRLWGHRRI